jgi:SAM-dependent methyltransferase
MLYRERARAESFGAVAELYDRARPSYPAALVDALLSGAPQPPIGEPARRVLDVGCGTGIAGALLIARGCAVLGIEVDERMAALARLRGLPVEIATFERWDARGRRFQLVTSGQAWHWIDPLAGATKAAEALGQGGTLALFWTFGHPPAQLAQLFTPIYAQLAPGLESYSALLGNPDARVAVTVEGIAASGRFAPAEIRTFRWSKSYRTAEWLALLQTHSDHHGLPPAQRERLLAAIGEAIDSIGGSFELPYETVLVSARRS